MNPNTSEPTLIIGAGLAGLVAALRLARAGRPVTVLEASQHLGGRARTLRAGDYHLNLGPHALYRAGAARRILQELQIPVDGAPAPLQGAVAWRGARDCALPAGLLSLLTTDLLPAGAKLEVARVLAGLGRAPAPTPGTTAAGWVAAQVRHPEARELLLALVRLATYADAPERLDAAAVVAQLARSTHGVLYLHRGWQPVAEALAAAVRAAGGQIRTRCRADRLLGARRVEGVALADGATLPAASVVMAVPPRAVSRLLEQHAESPAHGWATRLVPARASCLDVALPGPLPRPRRFFALGIDRADYASVHTSVADLGPGQVIHVARYLAPEAAPASRQALLQIMERLQPGASEWALHMEYHPTMTVTHGVPLAAEHGRRPGPEVPGLEGAFVAGDWVGQEGMLADAACASGDQAAQTILHGAVEAAA